MKDLSLETIVIKFKSKLNKKLQQENIDSKKMEQYIDAVEKAKEFCIQKFSEEFGKFGGQFTSHGPDHAARVLNYALIISKRLEPSINATELFILGLSAILHDVGMTAPLPIEITSKISDEDLRWNERRKRHGEATAEILINCEYPELKVVSIPDEDSYFKFLPKICAAHCTSGFENNINEIRRLKKQTIIKDRFEIIAGILLLADELDICYLRARPDINRYNEFKSKLTKAHWWKHWLISDVEISGNIINISCVDESIVRWSDEFTLWTRAKIEQQIDTLKNKLDANNDYHIWNFEIKIIPISEILWKSKLPELSMNIVETAQKNRIAIKGQKIYKVLNPEKLIEGVSNRNAILEPSDFFRKVIASKLSHFRGQGQYVDTKTARTLYVEESRNMNLLRHTIYEWKDYVENKSLGVKLKLFVGDIGVGKTHFLSVFLYEISTNEQSLFQKTIIARSEFTECERDNLLALQKHIAISLYSDLDKRLKLLQPIREIMLRDFSKGISPSIPKHIEEIESWSISEINSFIKVIGMICKSDSYIHKELGEMAPNSLCLFCDNSDQMRKETINELYEWCYNISGIADCLVWTFLRPDTLAYLERDFQKSPFSLRGAEPIYAPTMKEVICKRLATFSNRFNADDKIQIGSKFFSPNDSIESVNYIVGLTMDTSDAILLKLSERLDRDGQPNLRAGLQALISILGSHVISNEEYIKALLIRHTIEREENKITKPIFERWPKILEALIIGRRIWYSPLSGAIENLLDPPQIDSYGDYFLIIHCLQLLVKDNLKPYQFHDINISLRKLGYQRGRIQEILKYLSSRENIYNETIINEDPLINRTFPLVEIQIPTPDSSIKDNTLVQITPWGEFHLKRLLYQAQYWKHLYYQITFPASLTNSLNIEGVKGHVSILKEQLIVVFEFLNKIEDSWLYNFSENELADLGIYPVMDKIRDDVLKQLR